MRLENRKFSSISADSSNPTVMLSPSIGQEILLTDVLVCNTTSSDKTASIFINEMNAATNASNQNVFIVKDVLVPANTSIEIVDGQLPILNIKGLSFFDRLKGYASAAGVDVILGFRV